MRGSTHCKYRSSKTLATALCGLFALSEVVLADGDIPAVFHSPANDGVPAETAALPSDGSAVEIPLWIRPPRTTPTESAQVSKCNGDGMGDEICSWQLRIAPRGGATILGFVPAPGVRFVLDASGTVRALGGDPIRAGIAPQPVGILRAASGEEAGAVDVSGTIVRSTLEMIAFRDNPVAATPVPATATAPSN